MASQDIKTYHGNCHCAAFKYSIKVPQITSIETCNCSFCSRNAISWISPFPEENLTFERASIGELSIYEFGDKRMNHYFCKKCGSSVHAKYKDGKADPAGPAHVYLNARMFRDIKLEELETREFKGADIKSPYTPPPFPAHGETEEGQRIYDGNCHCGAVTFSAKLKPLDEIEALSCNCSLCSRNGELYVYPKSSDVTVHTGATKLVEYPLVSDKSLHTFCEDCGVSVMVRVLEKDDPVCPTNARTFQGINPETLKVKKYDGWSKGVPYVVQ